MDGSNSTFTVTNQETKEYLHITLNAFSVGDALEFKLESNIVVALPTKELFGLITRKSKSILNVKSMSLEQLKEYLSTFVCSESEIMQEYYAQQVRRKAA